MTKEQENALNHLKRLVGILIYPDDIRAIKVGIQAIKDLDKMNGIALDLAAENDELIEKLDAIRAEIAEEAKCTMNDNRAGGLYKALQIIDNYRGVSKDADGD